MCESDIEVLDQIDLVMRCCLLQAKILEDDKRYNKSFEAYQSA